MTNAERVMQTNYRDWGAPIIVGLHVCAGAGAVIIRPRDIRDASRYRVYLEGYSAITNYYYYYYYYYYMNQHLGAGTVTSWMVLCIVTTGRAL